MSKTTQIDTVRLFCSWIILGIGPLFLFFVSGMYRSKIVEPSLFVERLNRALAQFHVAYSAESRKLLHTKPVRSNWRSAIWTRRGKG